MCSSVLNVIRTAFGLRLRGAPLVHQANELVERDTCPVCIWHRALRCFNSVHERITYIVRRSHLEQSMPMSQFLECKFDKTLNRGMQPMRRRDAAPLRPAAHEAVNSLIHICPKNIDTVHGDLPVLVKAKRSRGDLLQSCPPFHISSTTLIPKPLCTVRLRWHR